MNWNTELIRVFNDGEALVSGIEIDDDFANHESVVKEFITDDMSNTDNAEDEKFFDEKDNFYQYLPEVIHDWPKFYVGPGRYRIDKRRLS